MKKRIKGKVIISFDNKLLIEISEDDYVCTDFDNAELILEGDYKENPDME